MIKNPVLYLHLLFGTLVSYVLNEPTINTSAVSFRILMLFWMLCSSSSWNYATNWIKETLHFLTLWTKRQSSDACLTLEVLFCTFWKMPQFGFTVENEANLQFSFFTRSSCTASGVNLLFNIRRKIKSPVWLPRCVSAWNTVESLFCFILLILILLFI